MTKFNYRAKNQQGSIKSGVVEAANRAGAVTLLKDRQLTPIEIKDAKSKSFIDKINDSLATISLKDKVVFARQLTAIINAGIPLLQALQLIEEQTANPKLKEAIHQIISDIQSGSTFAEALQVHTKVFSNLFISVVKSGEASGTLDESLGRLADQMEKDSEIQSKIKGAMVL
ncbi:MAG TPA: type II secretion system F family protein, partial [Candidatus Wirthbacteria bacterium]|nr:type II secretion system F family protein [Candidatus Wirthbacteria bacterium]